ncbi:hypothetical protein GCM10023235_11020 [Kitasatospora terrestris]|uniref:Secreted protein n=1 Tax=Kitasatospora terrestris TaxID=258051 RepID=A0ABP9DCD5_9ACTN
MPAAQAAADMGAAWAAAGCAAAAVGAISAAAVPSAATATAERVSRLDMSENKSSSSEDQVTRTDRSRP